MAWWVWLLGLALAGGVVAELSIAVPILTNPLAYLVAVVISAAIVRLLGRMAITVADGEFRVDDARLPVRFIADAMPIDDAGRRALLGVDADPMAFVVLRPWIPTGVRIDLNDPDDPTPYWYVSTRRPRELAEVLRQVRPGD